MLSTGELIFLETSESPAADNNIMFVTPEFKDFKDGQLKMISFFAKKARGMMVRYIIDTGAETLDDLKGFDYEGYAFDANLSKGNTLVFTR